MKLSDLTFASAPGPGDLDPGPDSCLGGACPHDHAETCEDCGHGGHEPGTSACPMEISA